VNDAAAERPALLSSLRAELPPDPARWREALVVGLATTTALALGAALQLATFAAPLFAYLALQHTTVCTWRNLVRRVLIGAAAGVAVVPLGGVLVQTPWLLIPVFFALVALLTYGIPMTRSPIEATLVAFPLIAACFSGTFEPQAIAGVTRDLVCAALLGVASATVFARLSRRVSARHRLAGALAASYERSRRRLAETTRRFLSEVEPAPATEAPVVSTLGTHVQLLDLARQEGLHPATDRLLATLITAAERIETYLGTVDTLSRRPVGRRYAGLLEPALAPLVAALDVALERFQDAALRVAEHDGADAESAARSWPQLGELVAAVRARQLELRRGGALASLPVDEGLTVNGVVQSLVSLADVLETPPWQLHRFAAEEQIEQPLGWPWNLLPLDRLALRFALQVALGATIAFVVGVASHVGELSTLLWNPVLVAQTSYGATIRKAWLRLLGVVAGGALAIATIVLVFANSNDLAVWLLVVFAVVTCCQHAVLARPTYWYGPLQVVVTYFFVLVGLRPELDVTAALWRAFGTLVGTAILFSVFRLIAPDYAGRQLVARLGDLLRATLVYLPEPGVRLAPLGELIAVRLSVGRYAADLLRLADEARLEGRASGVDPSAAVDAIGIALRVSLRAGLVARERATSTRPPLPAPGRGLIERLHETVRERVARALEVVDARHTSAPPGSARHDAACAAARRAGTRARTDLDAPLADALAYLARARNDELAGWPPEALAALFAELEHFRRLAELLPRLDAALEAMLLPRAVGASDAIAAPAALLPSVTRP
jgi:uncharacterized membrane protein YccC